MRIGIGCTTYKRPKHIELWKSQINKHSFNELTIHIADDSKERKGVAFRKNECLRALKDCDYIFLFDDDCFPIKDGWMEWFIEHHKETGQHHFLYLKPTPTIIIEGTGTINIYNNCAGCLMFLTKEAINKVGAFDERFGLYGFEHANYSKRIHMAGFTPLGEYLCPAETDEYIYSMDLDNHMPFNKQVKHGPSDNINNAFNNLIEANKHWVKPIESIYIPL